jgi:hypothetical protein
MGCNHVSRRSREPLAYQAVEMQTCKAAPLQAPGVARINFNSRSFVSIRGPSLSEIFLRLSAIGHSPRRA